MRPFRSNRRGRRRPFADPSAPRGRPIIVPQIAQTVEFTDVYTLFPVAMVRTVTPVLTTFSGASGTRHDSALVNWIDNFSAIFRFTTDEFIADDLYALAAMNADVRSNNGCVLDGPCVNIQDTVDRPVILSYTVNYALGQVGLTFDRDVVLGTLYEYSIQIYDATGVFNKRNAAISAISPRTLSFQLGPPINDGAAGPRHFNFDGRIGVDAVTRLGNFGINGIYP